MQLTPREFDKLIIHMMAEVALKRKAGGIKLNYPEAVAIISARALGFDVPGDKVGGVVASVGANVVHLKTLTGQEFFEAAVAIADVSAVVVRAKK